MKVKTKRLIYNIIFILGVLISVVSIVSLSIGIYDISKSPVDSTIIRYMITDLCFTGFGIVVMTVSMFLKPTITRMMISFTPVDEDDIFEEDE